MRELPMESGYQENGPNGNSLGKMSALRNENYTTYFIHSIQTSAIV
jgi:hypothetical protein